MTLELAGACAFIFLARLLDVSLGTLRTVAVIQGRRGLSWALGFVEVLVWIVVVSRVVTNLHEPALAVAYALGFATGNFLGITIEKRLAFGLQVIRVFTREGSEMVDRLRADGFRVTEFEGKGRDGPVHMLFLETKRKEVRRALAHVVAADPASFFLVDDIRYTSEGMAGMHHFGWRSILKKR